MQRVKKFPELVTKARALSRFNKIFGDIVDPKDGLEHLDFLEKSGKTWLICLGGYNQSTQYHPGYLLTSIAIEAINWFLISRLIILCLTDNHNLSFYLGDIFYGTSTRFYMNAVFGVSSILLGGIRSFIFWSEQFKNLHWMNYFASIKKNGFRTDMLHISQSDLKILRSRLYISRKIFTFFTPLTIISLASIFTFAVVSNPVTYSSTVRLIFIIGWTGATFVAAVFAIATAIWMSIHVYVLIVYTILRLDHITRVTEGLIRLPIIPVHLIRSVINEQSSLFNSIDKMNNQLSNLFLFGYNYAAFAADFLLYIALIMPKDNLFNNVLVFGFGIEASGIVIIIVYLSSTIHIKTHQTYSYYHEMIEKLPNVMLNETIINYKVISFLLSIDSLSNNC
ncbi:uncharacterized protein LOC112538605 [Tetranychus urticae]|uniref:uncharacterized protein LOC112538605 n=1 Tax=Tetranychus urticae TaxID=32264 RepID=UPI000D653115|nr:uncharacterized protein LOC112538605 [Tetranychus urticae]